MKLVNINFFLIKITNLFYRLVCNFLNCDNSNFFKNGEAIVLKELIYSQKEPFILFDVGTNIGEYTNMAIKFSKQSNVELEVHCFDPIQTNIDAVKTRFVNENIYLNTFALGSKSQKSYIYIKDETSSVNSLYNRIDDKQNKFFIDKKEIMIDTVDNYCKLNKVKRITLLKCDVEGHELEVLKGATECMKSDMIDYIQFEYGGASLDARTYLRDFYEILSAYYVICKIYKNGLVHTPYNRLFENFRNQNFVAINKRLLKI